MQAIQPVGDQLRGWRQRRRLSQLELALDCNMSQRHLSFVETGRARPSRGTVLTLAERLDVPLRDRNRMLIGAGLAPAYPERDLDAEALHQVREGLRRIVMCHEPWPALVIDRHWRLVFANRAVAPLLQGVAPHLLEHPVNVLRLALSPDGLAPRTLGFAAWRGHLLARLRHEVEMTADSALAALLEELTALPGPGGDAMPDPLPTQASVVPFVLDTAAGRRSFFTATTVFGTAADVTLSELAIEAFYPADAATAEALRRQPLGPPTAE